MSITPVVISHAVEKSTCQMKLGESLLTTNAAVPVLLKVMPRIAKKVGDTWNEPVGELDDKSHGVLRVYCCMILVPACELPTYISDPSGLNVKQPAALISELWFSVDAVGAPAVLRS